MHNHDLYNNKSHTNNVKSYNSNDFKFSCLDLELLQRNCCNWLQQHNWLSLPFFVFPQ